MKHISQLSTLADSVLVWRDDLPTEVDVTKHAVRLDEHDLQQLMNDLRREQLGANPRGDL